jgi:MFS family permease
MMGALTAAVFLTGQYFQLGLGYSPVDTGLRLLPWTATGLIIMPLGGALSDRFGRRPIMLIGMLLATIGLAWYASIASPDIPYFPSILTLTLEGVGLALALPVTSAAVLGAVAPPDMGKASGVNSTLQRFGSAFGVAVATTVFASAGNLSNPAAFTAGYRPALATVAVIAAVGAVLAFGVNSGRQHSIPRRGVWSSRPLLRSRPTVV